MITFGWWTSLPVLLLLAVINGGAQSLCWATGVKALAASLDEPERSRAVGIYATSSFGGGILASALAALLLSGADWTAIFTLPSIIVAVLGGVVLVGLQVGGAMGHGGGSSAAATDGTDNAGKAGVADATAVPIGDASGNGNGNGTASAPTALTSTQLIRIPMVLEVRARLFTRGAGCLVPPPTSPTRVAFPLPALAHQPAVQSGALRLLHVAAAVPEPGAGLRPADGRASRHDL